MKKGILSVLQIKFIVKFLLFFFKFGSQIQHYFKSHFFYATLYDDMEYDYLPKEYYYKAVKVKYEDSDETYNRYVRRSLHLNFPLII